MHFGIFNFFNYINIKKKLISNLNLYIFRSEIKIAFFEIFEIILFINVNYANILCNQLIHAVNHPLFKW
jgi:hypothetical protein